MMTENRSAQGLPALFTVSYKIMYFSKESYYKKGRLDTLLCDPSFKSILFLIAFPIIQLSLYSHHVPLLRILPVRKGR